MLAIAQSETDDLDRGAASAAAAVERFCALTREQRPTDELIRFVAGPAGDAVADVKRKLPGRGLWITATRDAITDAVKRNVFSRGFKREMKVSKDLAAEVEHLLAKSALDAWPSPARPATSSPDFPRSRRRSAVTVSSPCFTRPRRLKMANAS